jgi:hypothetical protein
LTSGINDRDCSNKEEDHILDLIVSLKAILAQKLVCVGIPIAPCFTEAQMRRVRSLNAGIQMLTSPDYIPAPPRRSTYFDRTIHYDSATAGVYMDLIIKFLN